MDDYDRNALAHDIDKKYAAYVATKAATSTGSELDGRRNSL